MGPSNGNVLDLPRIFTDGPAVCRRLPGGFLDFDTEINVLTYRKETDWQLAPAETRFALRCAYGGERRFQVDRRTYAANDANYLLFHPGLSVSSEVRSRTPVECLNVTFRPGFVEQAMADALLSHERLLDDPSAMLDPGPFVVRTAPTADTVSSRMHRIRAEMHAPEIAHSWLEEQFALLAADVVRSRLTERRLIDDMPGMRAATRLECYARMQAAREFMRMSLGEPITLSDVASVACMAPHHFLRTFKQSYRTTPHQYLTQLRLARACRLLTDTDMPVTDVCMDVGFESLGSFSWMFRRKFGVSPSGYRTDARRPSALTPVTALVSGREALNSRF